MIELLDPDYASRLLKGSTQGHVRHQRLLLMLEHFEELNGTSISIGDDGRLIDGHHRCTLVVITGKPLRVYFEIQPYHVEHL